MIPIEKVYFVVRIILIREFDLLQIFIKVVTNTNLGCFTRTRNMISYLEEGSLRNFDCYNRADV